MIAKAQADSVCAFFSNVEINFTLRSVFTNLPDGEFRMHLGNVEINFTLRSVFTKFVSLQMITLWDCLTEV